MTSNPLLTQPFTFSKVITTCAACAHGAGGMVERKAVPSIHVPHLPTISAVWRHCGFEEAIQCLIYPSFIVAFFRFIKLAVSESLI